MAVWAPDAAHEALRDLVRAREAAKKNQLRYRHRLGKFLLRHGKRPTDAGQAWTRKYLNWIRVHVRFAEPALGATLAHYLSEVEHAAERIAAPRRLCYLFSSVVQSPDHRRPRVLFAPCVRTRDPAAASAAPSET